MYGTEKPCCPHPKKEAFNKNPHIHIAHKVENRTIKSFLAGQQIRFTSIQAFSRFSLFWLFRSKGTKKVALMFPNSKADTLQPGDRQFPVSNKQQRRIFSNVQTYIADGTVSRDELLSKYRLHIKFVWNAEPNIHKNHQIKFVTGI